MLESETGNPPAEAAPLKETAQELVPGVLIVKGLQCKALKETDMGRVMLPAVPLDGTEVPDGDDVTTAVI